MKKTLETAVWTTWFMLAGAVPAFANNPPAPDGMLSVILLFPAAILGFRLAGATLNAKEQKWRIVRGVFLAVTALAAMAGTGIGAIALLILLGYGIQRGAQMMTRGTGAKRFALGTAMILFTLFATVNYFASLENWPSESRDSSPGAFGVRSILSAEIQFAAQKKLDANKNGVPEYGSLENLCAAGLIESRLLSPSKGGGYRFTVVLSGDPARDEKEFFVYASPVYYGQARRTISIVDAFRPHSARTTFAGDESGVIRRADLGGSRAVSREEAQKWEKLY